MSANDGKENTLSKWIWKCEPVLKKPTKTWRWVVVWNDRGEVYETELNPYSITSWQDQLLELRLPNNWTVYELRNCKKEIKNVLGIGIKDQIIKAKDPTWNESSCRVVYSDGVIEIVGYSELCEMF